MRRRVRVVAKSNHALPTTNTQKEEKRDCQNLQTNDGRRTDDEDESAPSLASEEETTDRQLELQLSRRTVRFLAEFRAAKVIFAIFVLFRKEGRFLRLVREREEKFQIFVSWFLRAVFGKEASTRTNTQSTVQCVC